MSSLTKPILTPARAIQQITENDPTFTECDLSGNATYLLKSSAFTTQLTHALRTNTHVKRVALSNLGITDASAKLIAEVLKVNKTLTSLDVSKNKFGSAGLIDLAEAITHNTTLLEIDLLGQSQPFGDQALSKIIAMFGYNITLKNISWRLQSRQSFAINKLIVRNNEIERRLSSGKSVLDILPEARKPDFGGVVGESYSPPEGTSQAVSNEEHHEVRSPRLPTDHHVLSTASAPSAPTSNTSTPSKPEPLRKTLTVASSSPANPKGGKMLSRYLQAAQAVDTPKEDTVGKPAVSVTTGATKLTSFFESKMEEASSITPRIQPTNPKPTAVRTSTVNPSSPRGGGTTPRTGAFSPRTSTASVSPPPATTTTTSSSTSNTMSTSPPPTEPIMKVSSIKEKFIAKSEPEPPPTLTSVPSVPNRVSSVWTPSVGEVKKTSVEPVVGGSNKLQLWQQRLEEEQKKQEEATQKKPIKPRTEINTEQPNPTTSSTPSSATIQPELDLNSTEQQSDPEPPEQQSDPEPPEQQSDPEPKHETYTDAPTQHNESDHNDDIPQHDKQRDDEQQIEPEEDNPTE